MRTLIPILVVLTLVACSGMEPTPAEPAGAIPLGSVSALPADPPSLRGEITRIEEDGRLRVEEEPEEEAGSAKAIVRLVPDALILKSNGTSADASQLEMGSQVAVWFTGPVMESYPVQAAAYVVVLD